LWFRWLSAIHDLVEANTHPASSPVCGWVLPNHLDNSLFFYDASGAPIGSFGNEHGVLTYRTRAGNLANPTDDPALDIGPQGSPLVNAHLATFMWYVKGRDNLFFQDWMNTILGSETFINPANYSQDSGLAVLIGRPLAITRAVLSMETGGALLPISQADTSVNDPFPQDINNKRCDYRVRQQSSSASLASVQFPVRIGTVPNLDDGLVGYWIEGSGSKPYETFYSFAAPEAGRNGVEQPQPKTVQLTLNAAPITLTMLVDPRADVHATTGVLPVEQLQIPPDQYSEAMGNLAMTFFTNPVLCKNPGDDDPARGLIIPLPSESGWAWEWISPGTEIPRPLKENAANDFASYSYSPQLLLEGWLKLLPAPKPPALKDT
jgi:hypothetical protein